MVGDQFLDGSLLGKQTLLKIRELNQKDFLTWIKSINFKAINVQYHFEIVAKIIEKEWYDIICHLVRRAKFDFSFDQNTPLKLAIKKRSENICYELLSQGTVKATLANNKNEILQLAASRGMCEVVGEILINAHVRERINDRGHAALKSAINSGNPDMAICIIESYGDKIKFNRSENIDECLDYYENAIANHSEWTEDKRKHFLNSFKKTLIQESHAEQIVRCETLFHEVNEPKTITLELKQKLEENFRHYLMRSLETNNYILAWCLLHDKPSSELRAILKYIIEAKTLFVLLAFLDIVPNMREESLGYLADNGNLEELKAVIQRYRLPRNVGRNSLLRNAFKKKNIRIIEYLFEFKEVFNNLDQGVINAAIDSGVVNYVEMLMQYEAVQTIFSKDKNIFIGRALRSGSLKVAEYLVLLGDKITNFFNRQIKSSWSAKIQELIENDEINAIRVIYEIGLEQVVCEIADTVIPLALRYERFLLLRVIHSYHFYHDNKILLTALHNKKFSILDFLSRCPELLSFFRWKEDELLLTALSQGQLTYAEKLLEFYSLNEWKIKNNRAENCYMAFEAALRIYKARTFKTVSSCSDDIPDDDADEEADEEAWINEFERRELQYKSTFKNGTDRSDLAYLGWLNQIPEINRPVLNDESEDNFDGDCLERINEFEKTDPEEDDLTYLNWMSNFKNIEPKYDKLFNALCSVVLGHTREKLNEQYLDFKENTMMKNAPIILLGEDPNDRENLELIGRRYTKPIIDSNNQENLLEQYKTLVNRCADDDALIFAMQFDSAHIESNDYDVIKMAAKIGSYTLLSYFLGINAIQENKVLGKELFKIVCKEGFKKCVVLIESYFEIELNLYQQAIISACSKDKHELLLYLLSDINRIADIEVHLLCSAIRPLNLNTIKLLLQYPSIKAKVVGSDNVVIVCAIEQQCEEIVAELLTYDPVRKNLHLPKNEALFTAIKKNDSNIAIKLMNFPEVVASLHEEKHRILKLALNNRQENIGAFQEIDKKCRRAIFIEYCRLTRMMRRYGPNSEIFEKIKVKYGRQVEAIKRRRQTDIERLKENCIEERSKHFEIVNKLMTIYIDKGYYCSFDNNDQWNEVCSEFDRLKSESTRREKTPAPSPSPYLPRYRGATRLDDYPLEILRLGNASPFCEAISDLSLNTGTTSQASSSASSSSSSSSSSPPSSPSRISRSRVRQPATIGFGYFR